MINFSVSNIGWDVSRDFEVATLLNKLGVKHLDIAPGRYFSDFYHVREKDVLKVKNFWNSFGISPYGMQSLLYGKSNLNVFGDETPKKGVVELS